MTRFLRMQLSKSTAEMAMKLTNRVTGRKRLTITGLGIALLIGLGICYSVAALATPRAGLLFNTLSSGTAQSFDSGSQNGGWQLMFATNGPTDIITQTISLLPGGFAGWHSHPGAAILTVTSGTLTFYQGNDPTCTPHVYPTGSSLVDHGGDLHIPPTAPRDALPLIPP